MKIGSKNIWHKSEWNRTGVYIRDFEKCFDLQSLFVRHMAMDVLVSLGEIKEIQFLFTKEINLWMLAESVHKQKM